MAAVSVGRRVEGPPHGPKQPTLGPLVSLECPMAGPSKSLTLAEGIPTQGYTGRAQATLLKLLPTDQILAEARSTRISLSLS